MSEFEIDLGKGKYTYIRDDKGTQKCLRYGQEWRNLVGDNLTLMMGYKIEEQAERIDELEFGMSEFNRVIEFIKELDYCDVRVFIKMWQEGAWDEVREEFPEFDLPESVSDKLSGKPPKVKV